ncbi:MAG: EFR1 family ferrodoxin, partial [Coriobacteriales bacterium]
YFTGTGNSLYIAKRLNEVTGERVLSIPECLSSNEMTFRLQPRERLGFVFPIHAMGIPWIVEHFIDHAIFYPAPGYGNEENRLDTIYTFVVMAFSASTGNTGDVIREILKKRNLSVDLLASIKMPDNYVIGEDIVPDEEIDEILSEADTQIDAICSDLIYRKPRTDLHKGLFPNVFSQSHRLYKTYGCKTAEFWVSDACVGCGICEQSCPTHSILIGEDGKPAWVDEKCAFCLGCINRCPHQAIQYGKKTVGRSRYINPILVNPNLFAMRRGASANPANERTIRFNRVSKNRQVPIGASTVTTKASNIVEDDPEEPASEEDSEN